MDWKKYFEDRGLDKELVQVYLNYSSKLSENNKPIIFEFEHLSYLLGISLEALASMIAKPDAFYREFSIPKKSSGRRLIYSPYKSLLHCQRWILKNILDSVTLHDACHGFRKNRSIVTNASKHLGGEVLLKMDLESFFPSIPISWVMKTFLDMGYAQNVAYYLSALCCYDRKLAQGAATSPALANIVCKKLDSRLQKLADKSGITYTRYADDLTFSGAYINDGFSMLVTDIVRDYGLSVNQEKTRLKIKNGSRVVTGISIQSGKVSIPLKYKRKIRNEFFFIDKFGILSHMSQKKISDPGYLYSLIGRVSFWLQVEPDSLEANHIKSRLTHILNSMW